MTCAGGGHLEPDQALLLILKLKDGKVFLLNEKFKIHWDKKSVGINWLKQNMHSCWGADEELEDFQLS